MKDIGKAIGDCVKDAVTFVAKIKDLVAALSGDVAAVVKVLVETAVHVFHDRKERTAHSNLPSVVRSMFLTFCVSNILRF